MTFPSKRCIFRRDLDKSIDTSGETIERSSKGCPELSILDMLLALAVDGSVSTCNFAYSPSLCVSSG